MKKLLALVICSVLILTSCGNSNNTQSTSVNVVGKGTPVSIDDNYKNYYEIYVGGFYDSNNDGIGDLNGITEKLSYLNDGDDSTTDDLGIDGIWLMPIMPSDTYHKYDVNDYYKIDSDYGTMDDFDKLVEECNNRGIDLILDLVLNHTSIKHSWFKSASESLKHFNCGQAQCIYEDLCPEHNKYCDYYMFSDEIESGVKQHQVNGTKWYYEGQFWDQMPDLNLDNEDLRKEILDIAKFWLDKGIKGFRLDATTHFYRENETENTKFLNWFYKELKKIKEDVYLVGEAWTDYSTIYNMYESKLPSFFNFPFSQSSGNIIRAINSNEGYDLAKKIQNNQQEMCKSNKNAIDAVFLTNHDNARSAGALARELEKEKMAAALYMMMPGNSFMYYGEEIGMLGSGCDENLRQPFVWSVKDKKGICTPVAGSSNEETYEKGLDEHLKDNNSLVNYYKQIIRIKNLNPEIARGSVTAIDTGENFVCAYQSEYNGKKVYVIHNLANKENTKNVTLEHNLFGNSEVEAYLSVKNENYKIENGKITLPSYSTIILKEK